jgi:hypothetical protein
MNSTKYVRVLLRDSEISKGGPNKLPWGLVLGHEVVSRLTQDNPRAPSNMAGLGFIESQKQRMAVMLACRPHRCT